MGLQIASEQGLQPAFLIRDDARLVSRLDDLTGRSALSLCPTLFSKVLFHRPPGLLEAYGIKCCHPGNDDRIRVRRLVAMDFVQIGQRFAEIFKLFHKW